MQSKNVLLSHFVHFICWVLHLRHGNIYVLVVPAHDIYVLLVPAHGYHRDHRFQGCFNIKQSVGTKFSQQLLKW